MGNELRRRRMLINGAVTPEESWDYQWDYTDGDLSNKGFVLTKGNGTTSYVSDGVQLIGANYNYNNTCRISVDGVNYFAKAVIEVDFTIRKISGTSSNRGFGILLSSSGGGMWGFIVGVSNGTNLLYRTFNGTNATNTTDNDLVTEGGTYTMRIEHNGRSQQEHAYIDGDLVTSVTPTNTTKQQFIITAMQGTFVVHSIRIKEG